MKSFFTHRLSGKAAHKTVFVMLLAAALCAVSLPEPVQAQTRVQRAKHMQKIYVENVGINLVPLPLFFNGFRLDVDARLKDNLWLQLAPQYNFKRNDIDRLDGFCLDVNLRYYVYNRDARGLYIAGGLGVDYNQVQYSVPIYDLSGFEEGALPDDPADWPVSGFEARGVNAFRLGGQVLIGCQISLWSHATMDFYVGCAFRRSFNSFPDAASELYMQTTKVRPWMYNFSGVYLQMGIRIGLLL